MCGRCSKNVVYTITTEDPFKPCKVDMASFTNSVNVANFRFTWGKKPLYRHRAKIFIVEFYLLVNQKLTE